MTFRISTSWLKPLPIAAAVVSVAAFGIARPSAEVTGNPSDDASTQTVADGVITGDLYRGGGPAGPPDKNGHVTHVRSAGEVTVFTKSGQPMQHMTVREGQSFSFRLAPGRYLLNSGVTVWDPLDACKAVRVTVQGGATAKVSIFNNCSIP